MKLAKKSLSLLLSVIIVMTSMSVCFGTFVFAADSKYTEDQVLTLINKAVASNFGSGTNNKYTFSGANSNAVMNAAEAVFDYATTYMMSEYGPSLKDTAPGSNAGSRSLADNFIIYILGESVDSNSNAAKFVRNILNPEGAYLYQYKESVANTKTASNTSTNEITEGITFTDWSEWNPNFPSLPNVTKTVEITRDLSEYLVSVDDLNDIPDSGIVTKVTYTFTNYTTRLATVDSVKYRSEGSGCNKKEYWDYSATGSTWYYLDSFNRAVDSVNTTAKNDLKKAKESFETIKNRVADEYLASYNLDVLNSMNTEARESYQNLVNAYSLGVVKKHVASDINEVLKNLEEAVNRLNNAATNMRNMIAYINAGFTPITLDNVNDVNIESYNALYAEANAAYASVVGLPDENVESVKSGAEDLKNFSKEASKKWLDELNESISLYKAVQVKSTIDNAYDRYLVGDSSNKPIYNGKDYISEEDLSNEAVELLKGNILALESSFNSLTELARKTVFGAASYDLLNELTERVVYLSNMRDASVTYETNYYQYFEQKFALTIGKIKNKDITAYYDEALTKKAEFEASYNRYISILGEDVVNNIFYPISYNNEEVSLATAISSYILELKNNIITRNNSQLGKIKEYANIGTVDFTNFTAVKNATSLFDEDLYKYVEIKEWLTQENVSDYALSSVVIEKVKAFVASGGLNFTQKHNHGDDGVFTVREGSTVNDIARKDGEDFAVTEDNINDTIAKLDSFLTSNDFTSLVGLVNPVTGEGYDNLTEAISEVLNENLFSNQMVNTIISALFPMLADTIGGLLTDLGSLGVDGIKTSTDPTSAGNIDLSVLAGDTVGGSLNLYLDGNQGTATLLDDLNGLGIKIYPKQLASMQMMDKYPQIKTAFEQAGLRWKLIVENPNYLDEDGNLNFDWGITDYNSFIEVVSLVLESVGPLLTAIISGKDYSGTLSNNAAYATSNALTINDIIGSLDLTVRNLQAYAKATINLKGQNIFNTLWIPLMEALGVTDYTASGYKFENVNANSSYVDIAHALFNPLVELIDQISNQPIDKVLSILPNLLYVLSMDKIQEAIGNLNIPLSVKLEITDIRRAEFGLNLSGIANLFLGAINGALPVIEPELNLGSLLDLNDLLGFDLSNINALASFILETVGINGSLPILDVGQFILASHVLDTSSQRPSRTRKTLVADKADVLYLLLDYLLTVVGDSELINAIIDFVQASSAEENPDAEPIEIPEIVYTILDNVGGNTEKALAALVELINPQTYDIMDFDWAEAEYSYSKDIKDFDATSIPYLKYSNDWTREKADYLIENIDEVLEGVLTMVGSDETSINKILQDNVSNLFNNENFTGFVEMLVRLGYLIDNEFIYDLLSRELGLDLRTWAKTFGSLFPEVLEEYPDAIYNDGNPFPEKVPTIGGVTFADGIWTVNGKVFEDGNRDTFIDLFSAVFTPFAQFISTLFTGTDLTLFNNAITIKGYENYKNTIGILFEIVGISELEELGDYQGVLTQEEYAAMDPDDAFNFLIKQLFAWVDYLFTGNTVEKIIELVPRFIYFLESNGLSVVLHNLLMPVLVILDVARPIINIDVNSILSTLISDILNSISDSIADGNPIELGLDLDRILSLLAGTGTSDLNPDHKSYVIDIDHLSLESIFRIIDTLIGTNLEISPLVVYGLKGLCSNIREIPYSVIGTAYGSDIKPSDTITILVTALLETIQAPCYKEDGSVTTNGQAIVDFVQKMLDSMDTEIDINVTEVYNTIIEAISGINPEYINPNWGYMFGGNFEIVNGTVTLPEHTINYLKYENNWTKETAETLSKNLDELVDIVLGIVLEDNTLAGLINDILNDNVYKDENLNTIVELIVSIFANIDESLRNLIGVAIDVDIDSWFKMCNIERDEDGKVVSVTCTKDFGIDSASNKKEAFANAIKAVLAPANRIISWIFFGSDFKFFVGSNKDEQGNYEYNDVVTLSGGKGYKYGIIPLLETLGIEAAPEEAFIDEVTGKYDAGAAVNSVIDAILNRVDQIAGKPADELLSLLPNIIYFINANGIEVLIHNLLASLDELIGKFAPILGQESFSVMTLIQDLIGIDLSDLTMGTLLDVLTENTDIVINDGVKALLATFYIGELTQYVSANGEYAYKMTYTDKESKADMITIVLSFVLEFFKENDKLLIDLIGEETYNAIAKILNLKKAKDMQEYSWLYTEFSDSDTTFTAIETSQKYNYSYDKNWTRAKAQYVADNIVPFVNNIVCLLGVSIGGIQIRDLTDLFSATNSSLYTKENIQAILDLLVGVVDQLKGLEPYGNLVIGILSSSIGLDLTAWSKMSFDFKAGDRDAFASALAQIIAPLGPIFKVLLVGEDMKFFYDINGNDQITIPGSEGYAYGIIPLLEALGCKDILTPDEFKAAINEGTDVAIKAVLDPVLRLLEDISTDPLQKILDMLPGIIYFINSNGLDTSVKNIINSVDTVIEALEPIIGAADVLSLAGIDLKTYNFDWLINLAIDAVKDSTGYDLKPLVFDAVSELTVGKVVSYKSANGETYYTMKYAGEADKADMITIVLRLVLEFIVCPENVEKVKAILAEYITDEKVYNMNAALIDHLATMFKQDKVLNPILALIYYVYYGVDIAVDSTHDFYHDVNAQWLDLIDALDSVEDAETKQVVKKLKDILNKNLDGIIDTDGVASDGFITFFQRIIDFFNRILDFFKNLFK